MVKEVRLTNVFWDTDFLSDPEVDLLVEKFGDRSLTFYIRIKSVLAKKGGYLDYEMACGLGRPFGTSRELYTEFVDFCLKKKILFKTKDDQIYSEDILQDIENVIEQRKNWRDEKNKGKNKQNQQLAEFSGKNLSDSTRNKKDSEHEHELNRTELNRIELEEEGEPKIGTVGEIVPAPPAAQPSSEIPNTSFFKDEINEIQLESAKMEYKRRGLEYDDVELGKVWVKAHFCKSEHAHKSTSQNQYNALTTWAIERVMSEKITRQKLKNAADPPGKSKFKTAEQEKQEAYEHARKIAIERDRQDEIEEQKKQEKLKNEKAGINGLLARTVGKLPRVESH